ncbi:MAG TPA: DUF1592 domain-containing protein [Fimbriimonadaceae bacterium]|nr:DUF1592 domain-containing protein [Fimbriimonadaceae bacterium]
MPRFNSLLLLLGPAVFVGAALVPNPQPGDTYKSDILPVLTKYCGPCHASKDNTDMSLAVLQSADSFKTQRETWLRIEENLANRHMPPPGNPAPPDEERKKLVASIHTYLGGSAPSPGRVTIRRLNRQEYNNTIRDLVGLDLKPADDFPSDDVGYGFDNIGDVLSMSPLLMDGYFKAAQDIAQQAIYTSGVRTWHIPGANMDAEGTTPMEDSRVLYTNASVSTMIPIAVEGDYLLRVVAHEDKAGDADVKMAVRVNSQLLKIVDVTALRAHPQTFELQFHATPGKTLVGVSFLNDYYKEKTATTPAEDRNLWVHSIDVKGPIGPVTAVSPTQKRIIFVQPTPATRVQCERQIFSTFASRAFRRPATEAEVSKLVAIAELAHKNGENFERGIQLGVTATLCSPSFLFRVEKPVNGPLSSYEIATRLSYFLWSSMPDDVLFDLAAKNKLQDPAVLTEQVKRMLKDPKASALGENFAGQWLQTRKLAEVQPDTRMFPEYTPALRRAMATETTMFFQDVVQNDRSVLDFIDGRYSFVNGPLAKLYGIRIPLGSQFMRLEMPPQRAGVVTQGSVLVVTSNPTRTSPVKRGKWILENILGTPPPPPPPGVGVLKDDKASVEGATLKERMEQHRKDPLCASCHKQMDGLGFALENFDAIGNWRTKDGKFDIDASGELPDGSKFTGPVELREILMRRKDQFVRCLAEKMLTYALGRGLESYDDMALDKIVKSVSDGEYKFSALVIAIVESDPFRKSTIEKSPLSK